MHGTAMGTQMAPSHAIILMGSLVQSFSKIQSHQPLVWWKYIENIFMVLW